MFQRRSSVAVACIALLLSSSLVAQKKDDKKQDDAQKKRIGQQLHSSLQYQWRNWLPTKKASMAMPPRNTPKGIS